MDASEADPQSSLLRDRIAALEAEAERRRDDSADMLAKLCDKDARIAELGGFIEMQARGAVAKAERDDARIAELEAEARNGAKQLLAQIDWRKSLENATQTYLDRIAELEALLREAQEWFEREGMMVMAARIDAALGSPS